MGNAVIRSINVGTPQQMQYNKKAILSGIFKQQVEEPLFLSRLNLEGDRQADLKFHGGPDKAICVYAYEHYPYWESLLERSLVPGAFGENLTIEGLVEKDVCIGDIFKFGEATVQISQPRQPCYKLSARYGIPEIPVKMQETGYTGFYLRVLQEGHVSREDGLIRLSSDPLGITVAFANRVMHQDKGNLEAAQRILEVEALSSSWRATFEKRLNGIERDTSERLTGQS
ncbi:MOSC domain-containing protein [Paenibacillus sp. YPG26]|uniref:MOSC domain-containing protein n=1 Tax=Paenibacillus sp. YPG26 TaxID=2878915 RepID=UPI00204225B8|nr:MOSC domain-containing protein [Paenibacillus sp. YPG26]USB34780.1 MOSC domain-containing protein [Paenibacillus sp. YPG26]